MILITNITKYQPSQSMSQQCKKSMPSPLPGPQIMKYGPISCQYVNACIKSVSKIIHPFNPLLFGYSKRCVQAIMSRNTKSLNRVDLCQKIDRKLKHYKLAPDELEYFPAMQEVHAEDPDNTDSTEDQCQISYGMV